MSEPAVADGIPMARSVRKHDFIPPLGAADADVSDGDRALANSRCFAFQRCQRSLDGSLQPGNPVRRLHMLFAEFVLDAAQLAGVEDSVPQHLPA